MSIAERINITVKRLPELKQIEVLDFVEYLQSRTEKEEYKEWNDLSLSSARFHLLPVLKKAAIPCFLTIIARATIFIE